MHAIRDLSGAGKRKLGLLLRCHVLPVPSVRYSTVLCTDSVTQADKGRPSGSLCPTHCTTGNYHHHHPISGVFKWGKLICRLGAVPVTAPCMHTFGTLINRNGRISVFVHATHIHTHSTELIQLYQCCTEMGDLRHMHTHAHKDSFWHQQIRMQRTFFINICHHTRGSALLSRTSRALQKWFIKLTLPFSAHITSCPAILPVSHSKHQGYQFNTECLSQEWYITVLSDNTTRCNSIAHLHCPAQVVLTLHTSCKAWNLTFYNRFESIKAWPQWRLWVVHWFLWISGTLFKVAVSIFL